MSNFWQRALTGTIFVVVLVGAILLGGWYLHMTFGLVVFFGLLEFYKLFAGTEVKPQAIVGTVLGSTLYASFISIFYASATTSQILIWGNVLGLLIIVGIVELFRGTQRPFENIAITCTGIFYIAVPFSLLNLMGSSNEKLGEWYEPWNILSIFILIWSNDTFAYLTGRLIGKHKLFERISPKKTWEGFFGGVVFAIAAAALLAYFLDKDLVKYISYALIVSVIGTLGDLAESMLKRSVNIKDSGTILPGHGGILDRFDAVLFVVPVIFFLEMFIFA